MTVIGHLPFVALFDRVSICLGGNEKAHRHHPESSPTQCAWRLERGSKASKLRLMVHNVNAVLHTLCIETTCHAGSRSIAATKSP
jgi:hypothetical protein